MTTYIVMQRTGFDLANLHTEIQALFRDTSIARERARSDDRELRHWQAIFSQIRTINIADSASIPGFFLFKS